MGSVPSPRITRGRGAPSRVSRVRTTHRPHRLDPRSVSRPNQSPQRLSRCSTFSSPPKSSRRHSGVHSPRLNLNHPHPYFNHPNRTCLQTSHAPVHFPSLHSEFRNLLSSYHPCYLHSHLPQYDHLSLRWVSEWDNILSPSPSFLLQLGLPVPEAFSPSCFPSSASSDGEDSGVSSGSEDDLGEKKGDIHSFTSGNQQPAEASETDGSLFRSLRQSSFRRLPVFSQLTQRGVQDSFSSVEERAPLADAFLDSSLPTPDLDNNSSFNTTTDTAAHCASSPESSSHASECVIKEQTVSGLDDLGFEGPVDVGHRQPAMPGKEHSGELLGMSELDPESRSEKVPESGGAEPNERDSSPVLSGVYHFTGSETNSDHERHGAHQVSHVVTEYGEQTAAEDAEASAELGNRLWLTGSGHGDQVREEQDMEVEEESVLNTTAERNTANCSKDCDHGAVDCADMDDTESDVTRNSFPHRNQCVTKTHCVTTSSLSGSIMSTGSPPHTTGRDDSSPTMTGTTAITDRGHRLQDNRSGSDVSSENYQRAFMPLMLLDEPSAVSHNSSVLEELNDGFPHNGGELCSKHQTDEDSVSQVSEEVEQGANKSHGHTDLEFEKFQNDPKMEDSNSDKTNENSASGQEDGINFSVVHPETQQSTTGAEYPSEDAGFVHRDEQELTNLHQNLCNPQSKAMISSSHTVSRRTLVCKRRIPRKIPIKHSVQTSSVEGTDHPDVIKIPPVRSDFNTQRNQPQPPQKGSCMTKQFESAEVINTSSAVASVSDKRRAAKRPFICTIEVDAIIRILQQCDLLE